MQCKNCVGSEQFSQGDPGLCWVTFAFPIVGKDATVEVVPATCHKCSAELCL